MTRTRLTLAELASVLGGTADPEDALHIVAAPLLYVMLPWYLQTPERHALGQGSTAGVHAAGSALTETGITRAGLYEIAANVVWSGAATIHRWALQLNDESGPITGERQGSLLASANIVFTRRTLWIPQGWNVILFDVDGQIAGDTSYWELSVLKLL